MKDNGSKDPLARDASLPRGAFDLRRFTSDAALVVGAAAIGNLFSYAFHFVLSRKLGPTQYGTLVTMTSIAGMLGVVGVSLGTVAMQETAKLWTMHLDVAISAFVRGAGRFVFAIAAAIAIVVAIAGLPLGAYLHVERPQLWLLLAAYVAISMFTGFARGAAQGAHRFGVVAASFVSEGAVKVGVALWLVALGFGVAGAMGGLIASTLIAVAIVLFPNLRATAATVFVAEHGRLGRNALKVLAVGVTANALLFIDMVFAKHHFSGELAGYFGAAGTVARTIPFGIGLVALIVMPKAAAASHAGRESLTRVLALTAAIAAVGVALGLVLIASFPQQIVRVTYGAAFAGAVPLLRIYALDEALLALWLSAVSYCIAVARYEVFALLVAATAIEAAGMAAYGSQPVRLLSIAIIVNAALVPMVWMLALRTLRSAPQAANPLPAENSS